MKKSFRLSFSLLILLNVLIGGLGVIRLFSWNILSNVDKFFFIFVSVLFLFSMFIAFLLSNLDDVPVTRDDKREDKELKELREEVYKPVPIVDSPKAFVPSVSEPLSILRNPEPMKPVPPIVRALTEDVSMYENRNIIKPPITQEDKVVEKSEYEGIF